MKTLQIIKIGGNVVDDPAALERFLYDFSKIKGAKLLIHGGGVMATQMAERLGIETHMHKGRRITDYETLKTVTMVYAGWINKSIVAALQSLGCNAIGLSGADCNVVPATKRSPEPVDFGYVGDVDPSNIGSEEISALLERGLCPVFCAITHDGKGSLLNTNADTMASSLAIAMCGRYDVRLVFCLEKDGVLLNKDDASSIVPRITENYFAQLLEEGIIEGGMIPKLENAFAAIGNGVSEVVIKHARNLNNKRGTTLVK
ncbi:MAG: acetylglutamate kinase [Bacteroidales bacterium]|jgi:acetylglutamate kinase|nr:acetylglutamate kinase [Bacteroidales bacterium]